MRWLHDRTPPAGQVATGPQPWPEDMDRVAQHYVAFWVATEPLDVGEAVIGMAGLSDPTKFLIQPPAAESFLDIPDFVKFDASTLRLNRMRVAPERQGRGVGRLLTQTAIDWARARGCERLILDTTSDQEAAIALYEALGFQQRGRTSHGRWKIVWFELLL